MHRESNRDRAGLEQLEPRRLFAAMPTYIDVDISQEISPMARAATVTVRNLYAGERTPGGHVHIVFTGNHGDAIGKTFPLNASGQASFIADMYYFTFSFTYVPANATHAASGRQMFNTVPKIPGSSTTTLAVTEVSQGRLRLHAEVLAMDAQGDITFTTSTGATLGTVALDANGRAELFVETAQANLAAGDVIHASYSRTVHHVESSASVAYESTWQQRHEVHFADVNGDGHLDRVFRSTADAPYTIELLGPKGLIRSQALPPAGAEWTLSEIVDLTGDGNAEFIWESPAGKTIAWLRNPGAPFAFTSLGTTQPAWTIEGDGDFNNDGKADLLWRNTATGQTCVWFMNGTTPGGYAMIASTPADRDWAVAEISDFNGDGKMDLLWRNSRTGGNYLWFLDGTTLAGGRSLDRLSSDGWQVAGIFELDGDGDDDILFYHRGTGETLAWLMDGSGLAAAERIVL